MNLFCLDFAEEQLDFPVLYASAKEGWASLTFTKSPPDNAKNMSSLLDSIVRHVPSPKADLEAPFQMLVSILEEHQNVFLFEMRIVSAIYFHSLIPSLVMHVVESLAIGYAFICRSST
jgi:predicted membrane GTPase involved in stress response